MRKRQAAAIAALVASVTLTGCSELPEGLHGKVIDRDRDTKVTSKWDPVDKRVETETRVVYTLTTEHEDGAQAAFRVSSSVYKKCVTGSQYPKCFKK